MTKALAGCRHSPRNGRTSRLTARQRPVGFTPKQASANFSGMAFGGKIPRSKGPRDDPHNSVRRTDAPASSVLEHLVLAVAPQPVFVTTDPAKCLFANRSGESWHHRRHDGSVYPAVESPRLLAAATRSGLAATEPNEWFVQAA